jgi:hypothetical protein
MPRETVRLFAGALSLFLQDRLIEMNSPGASAGAAGRNSKIRRDSYRTTVNLAVTFRPAWVSRSV